MNVLPADFGNRVSGSVASGLIDGVANWCEALAGGVSLQAALTRLLRAVHAEAGMLVRTHRTDARPVAIATHDTRSQLVERPLRVSYADSFFGTPMLTPRNASIWQGSVLANDADPNCSPALREWQASRGLKDFVVLVLSGGPTTRDHIELHFSHHLSTDVLGMLTALLPTLARTWAARQVGLVTRTVVNHRIAARPTLPDATFRPILGPSNPARLSRAEFRVCLLLSRGLSVAGISEELKLSDATIRTHLRNTYAKANTSSLAELVFLLLSSKAAPDLADIRCA